MKSNFLDKIKQKLLGRSIFLIGMMASGKSKTGPKLAELLNYKFIDLDLLIEKVAKKSVRKIFKEDGEQVFRDIETLCLKEIIKVHSLIISTGGGIVLSKENWGILSQGITVWMDIDEKVALERLSNDLNKRPLLLEGDIKKNFIRIYNSRKNLYDQADLKVKIIHDSVEKVVEKIIIELDSKINH